ncbi:MAG: 50S ribosomal protein L11 methyltransferase [Microthrixaceae bacterium]
MTGTRQVVQVEVPSALVDLVTDVLWRGDPSAVRVDERPDGSVCLTADLLDLTPLTELPADAQTSFVEVDGEGHLDAWRAWAAPVRAGRRVVLVPAWQSAPTIADDDLALVLDPGRAFGSGSHPSTRLAVAALEDRLVPGGDVLDVGCGSGVLAVVAGRLGAAFALAIDTDPAALAATLENATANGVGHVVTVKATPLSEIGQAFDLVVANIGARVLRELASDLARCVRPGGWLVLSGLLAAQADEVVAAFPMFTEVERGVEEGWVAPVLRRSS